MSHFLYQRNSGFSLGAVTGVWRGGLSALWPQKAEWSGSSWWAPKTNWRGGSSYRGLSWCVRDNLALRRQPRSRPVPPTGGATAVSFSKTLTRSHSGCLHPQLPRCADRQWLSRRAARGGARRRALPGRGAVRAAPPSLSWGARHSPHPAEGNSIL